MNNYFCVLPFFSKEIYLKGFNTPCCLLPKNANIKNIQQQMLDKQRPTECERCWELEDKNLKSDRQLKNAMYDFYINKDINFIEQDCIQGKYSPKIIKLYTSNACNASCVTCGPTLSSKWQSLKKVAINYNTLHQSMLNSVQWKEVVSLSIIGGEPFYEPKNLELLEMLSIDNPNCFISITTNGSIKLNKRYKNLFQKLKNLNICVSLDGINEQFEYIRYPLKWATVTKNIQDYISLGSTVSVSFTISNLNIINYEEITDWLKQNNLDYNHNLVKDPAIFNIENLPVEIKKSLPFVTNKEKFDINLFSKFIKEIRYQDSLKNINIRDYLPDLSKVIDDFEKNI